MPILAPHGGGGDGKLRRVHGGERIKQMVTFEAETLRGIRASKRFFLCTQDEGLVYRVEIHDCLGTSI